MNNKFLDILFDLLIFLGTIFFIVGLPTIYILFIPSDFWKGVLVGAHFMLIIKTLID
ncbi:MAG: hypothetical protein MJ246_06180 [Clostridia bacterium]|nr:hypothetical protein [Clostridia bacterium]